MVNICGLLTLNGEHLDAVVVLVGDDEMVSTVAADGGWLVELTVALPLHPELGVKGAVRLEQLDPVVRAVSHHNQAVLSIGCSLCVAAPPEADFKLEPNFFGPYYF